MSVAEATRGGRHGILPNVRTIDNPWWPIQAIFWLEWGSMKTVILGRLGDPTEVERPAFPSAFKTRWSSRKFQAVVNPLNGNRRQSKPMCRRMRVYVMKERRP
jgi:hypothetical protein